MKFIQTQLVHEEFFFSIISKFNRSSFNPKFELTLPSEMHINSITTHSF